MKHGACIVFFVFSLMFLSCTVDLSPPDISESLPGKWVEIRVGKDHLENVPYFIKGFQFDKEPESQILSLAIDTRTGCLTPWRKTSSDRLLSSRNDSLIFQSKGHYGDFYEYSLPYKIDESGLHIGGESYFSGDYKKYGDKPFTDPLVFTVSFKRNGEGFIPTTIWPHPPAFASLVTSGLEDTLHFYVTDASGLFIRIKIANFEGVGEYIIGTNGDATGYGTARDLSSIAGLETTEDDAGIITITEFDQTHKRCSGNFSFKIETTAFGLLEYSDGSFDVPLFLPSDRY